MKRSTFTVWACLPVLLVTFTGTYASSWTCHKADLTRHVLVFYPDGPAQVPCKVMYSKPMENVMPRALWESANTHDYCERKAIEFVTRLESMDWHCVEDDLRQDASSEPEKMPDQEAE